MNRPLEASSTHAYLLTPSAHGHASRITSKIKSKLAIIIGSTGIGAMMLFRFEVQVRVRVRVRVEGHLRPYFLGTGIAVGPRRRDEAAVRVVGAKHGNLAAKCASGRLGFSRGLVHDQREDEILGRAHGKRPQGVLGPSFQGARQVAVRFGALAVHPDFDLLVELPEELEGDAGDFQLADDVPCDERVKDLLCDVERRKVLYLWSP